MGWVDREYIHVLMDDDRYTRLLNLTRRMLEDRMPTCGNCQNGQITIRDADGNETTITCDACGGEGHVPTRADNQDDGQVGGR